MRDATQRLNLQNKSRTQTWLARKTQTHSRRQRLAVFSCGETARAPSPARRWFGKKVHRTRFMFVHVPDWAVVPVPPAG